jgi:tRNA modification GTPase
MRISQASDKDTVCAIATPPGKGGVGIIRISGSSALSIAKQVASVDVILPRKAHFSSFKRSDELIDTGLLLYFPGPNSFTGEDVVELQTHGSPVVLNQLLALINDLGGRLAEPGEFSKRAFLNNKLDLVQAEAIADLINANTEMAAKNAQNSLQGAFSNHINALLAKIIGLRILVEAAIDFPEEEIDFVSEHDVLGQLQIIINETEQTLRQATQGQIIQEGLTVALIGAPNAGKSSLLNELSGLEKAIVTDIPGTTRDTLETVVNIKGVPVTFVDTAGLRHTDDIIEQAGIQRALNTLKRAQLVLFLIDSSTVNTESISLFELLPTDLAEACLQHPFIGVSNKIDLLTQPAPYIQEATNNIPIAAKLGLNIGQLEQAIIDAVQLHPESEHLFSARQRHISALQATLAALRCGLNQLRGYAASELLAEDLRLAQQAINSITGEFTNDDLLGEIFSSFCIGK